MDSQREDGYHIRRARRSDRTQLLELYQSVLDPTYTHPWLQWKYFDNPFADDLPIFVSTWEDDVVGAGGFVPLRMHTPWGDVDAVQPCDAAVHPTHRRNGLYTDILGAGLRYYANTGTAFAFDFPNALSRATFEKHGWQAVTTRESFIRIHDLSPFTHPKLSPLLRPLCQLGVTSLAAWRRLRSRSAMRTRTPPPCSVVREDEFPVDRLVALHQSTQPTGIHATRTATFYHWRFSNPLTEYHTYIATQDGQDAGAIVTGQQTHHGADVTYLTEVLPLARLHQEKAVSQALLESIINDCASSDLVVAMEGTVSADVIGRMGFASDCRFPLSLASNRTVQGVKALQPDISPEMDASLANPQTWSISFTEFDTR